MRGLKCAFVRIAFYPPGYRVEYRSTRGIKIYTRVPGYGTSIHMVRTVATVLVYIWYRSYGTSIHICSNSSSYGTIHI